MNNKVVIIGGGVAGMQAAITLSELGLSPIIIEKESILGGKLNKWDRLFPTMTPASEVLNDLSERLKRSSAEVLTSRTVKTIENEGRGVILDDNSHIEAEAVVVASGFDLFPAELKEEYGYGIYDNVITTVDLEHMFKKGPIKMADGSEPKTIAFLHCVGSRDEKVNQRHCSRVCCITGVKQAIELKRELPNAEIYNFYMDMRMFGPGYEELYRQAQQEYNIHFIRGKISEASQTIDNRVQIKAEDTLVGLPIRMSVDMLILIVGMKAAQSNLDFSNCSGVDLYASGFIKPANIFTGGTCSDSKHIFYAGTATAPKNIGETITEAIAAAYQVAQVVKA